jgi:hypothetical protein
MQNPDQANPGIYLLLNAAGISEVGMPAKNEGEA